ncbi:MAG: FG-GAP-like repeat-containing protein [Bacteroidota bacterium]
MSLTLKCLFLTAFTLCVFAGIAQKPTVRSFFPINGPVGTGVTIKGTNFSPLTANNTVYFGAVRASVVVATDTTLLVVVPAGSTYLPVSVTTNNLTGYAQHPFVVTFPGGGGTFTSASFMPKMDVVTGMYPHWVGLADFNGNGKADIIVSRGSSSTVSVFPNNSTPGSIILGAKQDFNATGSNHEGGAIADFDGDGKLDFVLTNSINANSVSVYRNTSATGGTILFTNRVTFAVDNAPYGVAVGDIDGDGKPDMAVPVNGSLNLCIFRNTSTPGSITFAPRIDYSGGTFPYEVAISDLDGDGKPDVAITTQGGSPALSVMKNNSTSGNIVLETPVSFASGVPFTVFAGDLNNDGKPDLAGATGAASTAVVLTNTSTPGTIDFGSSPSFVTGSYVKCVAITDLDGDSKPDLFTANNSSHNVSALRNTTTGGNITFEGKVDYATNLNPQYVAAGDLDGDGKPEILCANSSSDGITILRNIIGANVVPVINSFTPTNAVNGTVVTIKGSNFSNVTSVTFGGVAPSSFTIDSATGITAVVGDGASGSVSATNLYGTGSLAGFNFIGPLINAFNPTIGENGTLVTITGANFTGATSVSFGGIPAATFTVNSPTSITATVGTGASGNVSVTTATGTVVKAGFSYGLPVITSFSPVKGAIGTTVIITGTNFSPLAADNFVFFGGVKTAVIAATTTQLTVTVPPGATYKPITVTRSNLTAYSKIPFHVTYPLGASIVDSSFVNSYTLATGNYPVDLTACDLNNDGKPDVIVVNSVGNSISVFKNNSAAGNMSFSSKTDYSTGPSPKRVATGDLDGDGRLDIIITNMNSGLAGSISIFRNTSIGPSISFATKVDLATGNGSIGISIGDLNIDGKPDVIVASGNSGYYSIFTNTTLPGGAIMFTKQDKTFLDRPDVLTIADIDNDGKPDLVTANATVSSISVLRNISTGNEVILASRVDFPTGSYPYYLATTDFDSDGKLDLMVSNYTSANMSMYKNESTPGTLALGIKQDYALEASALAITDINGDGKLDFCAGKGGTGTISVLENAYMIPGNFSFNSPVVYTSGNFDTYVSTCDLDGDGRPEIMAANTIQNNVVIYRNKIGTSPLVPNPELCNGGSVSFSSGIAGANYQWQVNSGNGFSDIGNDSNYNGANSAILQVNNAPSSWYGYQYRSVVQGSFSNVVTLRFSSTWTGAVDNVWENPANWKCGVVPDGNTDVIINAGTVLLTSNLSCRSLTVKPGATVNIATGYNLTITH